MRILYTKSFVGVRTLGLIILIGSGFSAFGQGKGHGGDKGDKGNHGQSAERGEGRHQNGDRQAQRQERGQQENEGRNKHDNRPDNNRIQRQPEDRNEPGRGNGNWKQKDRRDERPVYPVYPPQQQSPPGWSNVWRNNYGQQRSSEVHARNAERKALGNQARTLGGYYPQDRNNYDSHNAYNQPYAYDQRYSYDPRNTYQQRDSVRSNILRSVIGLVLGNNTGSRYYAQPYNDSSYGVPYNPAYNGGYYIPSSQNQGYREPYYNNYQTNTYPYASTYGGNQLYSNGGASQVVVPLLTSLLGSRGGFFGRLVGQLLASGYNQGYQDARYAQANGYGGRNYQDPYAYENTYSEPDYAYQNIGYDPYSSLAENRRYMSEGYELGYRDALNTRNQSFAFNNVGGGDLISLLLGSVLRVN